MCILLPPHPPESSIFSRSIEYGQRQATTQSSSPQTIYYPKRNWGSSFYLSLIPYDKETREKGGQASRRNFYMEISGSSRDCKAKILIDLEKKSRTEKARHGGLRLQPRRVGIGGRRSRNSRSSSANSLYYIEPCLKSRQRRRGWVEERKMKEGVGKIQKENAGLNDNC